MNIVYDIFVKNPEWTAIANSIPEIDEGLMTLLEFVKARLMPLASENDAEEDAQPDKPIGTIIFFHPPPQAPNRFLLFAGYSQHLGNKMASCFSPSDVEYIENKLEFILNKWQQ